ncbi:MAG: carboxylate-amine ligase [Dehalococcoidia bacterium]
MPEFTIGIEEEFQIVDRKTLGLKSHVSEMLQAGGPVLGDQLHPEMLQSVVEVATKICKDVGEAREELVRLRGGLAALSAPDLTISGSGTHPVSDWRDQAVTEGARYLKMMEDMGDVARTLAIFGLHVHVQIENRDHAIHVFNQARYFLPHLLALSTSSPFWMGRLTGLKSYRHAIWNQMPRTGMPDTFESYSHFQSFVDLLVQTNCIDDGKRIWWDIRPHPYFNTLEFRVCDMQSSIEDSLALAALSQAIVARLYDLRINNLGFREYPRAALAENRWRAMRYGLDGNLIDFGKREEVPERKLIEELLKFVEPVVDDLNSRREINHIGEILETGTSADRQIKVWEETHDMDAVTRMIMDETMAGIEPVESEVQGVAVAAPAVV